MGLLEDVLYYQSGTECPDSYTIWATLSLHGALLGRKVWLMHGDYFPIYPNLYVCLVGSAGSGKSTGLGFARSIMVREFPDYFLNADAQSYQHIARAMASPECEATGIWKNDKGLQMYRPFYCLVDELSLFLETNMAGTLQFMTRLFTADDFSTGFKSEENLGRSQKFLNPFFSFLACAIPEWLMTNLKIDLFQGGLGRRMMIVNDQKTKCFSNPTKPKDAAAVYSRILAHLREARAERTHGEVKKTHAAQAWWDSWYNKHFAENKKTDDPMLHQLRETLHIPLLKVALVLSMNEMPFTYTMTDEHLDKALHLIKETEGQVVKLTSGLGRNELAGVGAQLLDFIDRLAGLVPHVQLRMHFRRYLNTPEFWEVIRDFESTGQIQSVDIIDPATGSTTKWVGRPDKIKELLETQRRKALEPKEGQA